MLYRIAAVALALASAGASPAQENVSVRARVVVVDREAASRAGVTYLTLADGRVQVGGGRRGTIAVQGPVGIGAFLDLARRRRWTRSESTQRVTVLSGSEAHVASLDGGAAAFGTRSRGPSLTLEPTVLADGRIRLRVATGVDDRRETPWGSRDASPAWAETEVIVRPGEEVVVASSSVAERSDRSGVLRLASTDRTRDVMIVLDSEVLP